MEDEKKIPTTAAEVHQETQADPTHELDSEETRVVKKIGDQARAVDDGNPELQGTDETEGEDMMSNNGVCGNVKCAMD